MAEVIADHALGSHERHSELLPGDGRCEPQVELATIRGPQVDGALAAVERSLTPSA